MTPMMTGGSGMGQMFRMAQNPAEVVEDEPLYVNAKQYHRILKRRQARAKLEAAQKMLRDRKVGSSLVALHCRPYVEPVLMRTPFLDFLETVPA
jgi:hypothetical protein